MRIVQIVLNLDIGGLERLAADLARCQKAAGHQPSIYCLTHRGAFADQVEADGIPVIAFNKPPGYSVPTLWRMARQLRRDRPDVVHTHNHLVHHYGVAAGKLARVPVIVNTRHREEVQIRRNGHGFVLSPESPDKKADRIYRATLPWTDAVVMISESTRRFFVNERGLPPGKMRVILNGAPVEPFLAERARPGASLPKFRFGTAGRMVPAKDHFTLIDAFARVARELPAAELHFAGNGPLRQAIEERVAALGLKDSVVLHGARFDMPRYLSALDMFVLSSLSEGLPIVILEAMAAGLPIASTRVAGVPEAAIEGRVARFAELGDAEGLARIMLEMARSPDLARMGAEGRDLVQRRFTIAQTWAEYEALFHEFQPHR